MEELPATIHSFLATDVFGVHIIHQFRNVSRRRRSSLETQFLYWSVVLMPYSRTHIDMILHFLKPFVGDNDDFLCRHQEETDTCGRVRKHFDTTLSTYHNHCSHLHIYGNSLLWCFNAPLFFVRVHLILTWEMLVCWHISVTTISFRGSTSWV